MKQLEGEMLVVVFTYIFLTLMGLISLIGAMSVVIYIKQKKYWYIPYGIMMMLIGFTWGYDSLHDTNHSDYVMLAILTISIIESLVLLFKNTRLQEPVTPTESSEDETEQEAPVAKKSLFWIVTWLIIKMIFMYIVFNRM